MVRDPGNKVGNEVEHILKISENFSLENLIKHILMKKKECSISNRTKWSPIRSVILRVISKADDRSAGVRFVYHMTNWTKRSFITN